MVAASSIIDEIQSLVGAEHVLSGSKVKDHHVDGHRPQLVAEPGTYDEVAAILRYAARERIAVVPWGGGKRMGIGNIPRAYDVALSLSRLDRMIEHEPADLTATCQAGFPLGDLQKELAQTGQTVPFDHFAGPRATTGGTLASDASGPGRLAYGTARDFTIGMRVVTADGRIVRVGGNVVKNVAGYDLAKLFIGSMGTLGIIVEATFKLRPLPQSRLAVAAEFASSADIRSLAHDIHRGALSVSAMQLLNDRNVAPGIRKTGYYVLVLDVAGTALGVERSVQEIQRLVASHAGTPLESGDSEEMTFSGRLATIGSLVCKLSILPRKLPELITHLESVGSPYIVAYPVSGVVYASWLAPDITLDTITQTRAIAARLAASCVFERCPPDLKRRIDVFGDVPPKTLELMRRIKQQFDPNGILSPGRFVGRI
jgi:glycolate oxidase FAD binding subunit